MKKALVIGAAGFVGRHLCPKLNEAGYFVIGVDPKFPFKGEATAGSKGINYRQTFQSWWYGQNHRFAGETYDLIIHLGAHIEDVNARLNGGLYQYDDIALDMDVAKFVQSYPPTEAFVWPTSCAVDNPDDPYAWVKLTGERLFKCLDKQGIRVVILRPYSGYGGDQAWSYPFPAILGRAVKKEKPLTVWGSGNQVRDFVHIDDLTDAFMHGIKCFPSGVPIDIGTGRGTNFLQLAYMMADAVGYETLVKPMTEKAESSPRRVANIKQAAHFGWTAKIRLEEGIRRAINEIKNRQ
jgi:nucleoside-diphosphate-sugar epimerase